MLSRVMFYFASLIFFACSILNVSVGNIVFAEEEPLKVVRVGYFSFNGYHDMDNNGSKSGYGYEILQQMKRYENWKYEYVGYDKTWGEMLEMLDNGGIDMLTAADVDDDTLKRFDFSNYSIGVTSTILTVRQNDLRFEPGNYETYNGMRVGMLRVNSKNTDFANFALKNNINYIPCYYDNTDDLEKALADTREIDAILTGSMRKINDEKILEAFSIKPAFVIVKKGNKELLNEVNDALVHMNMDDPLWATKLKFKYYNIEAYSYFNLTFDDREIINHINASGKVFRVLVDTEKRPYSYYDKDGKMRGIVVDIFELMAQKLGVNYEYLPIRSKSDYQKAIDSGAADIILDAKFSLQEVENMGFQNVGTYLSTPLALYYRRERSKDDVRVVATVPELLDNVYAYFDKNKVSITACNTDQECKDLLERDKVDAIFIRSQRASDFLANDYRNEHMALVLPEQLLSYSLLVKETEYALAPSFFAKACASISRKDVELISLKYKDMSKTDLDLRAYIYMKPMLFLWIAVLVLLLGAWALRLQIKRSQEVAEKNRRLKEANDFLTERDGLTGGYNRQGFSNAVQELCKVVDLTNYNVLFIDVKNIKAINEMWGTEQGDNILRLLYKTLKESFLKPSVIARTESDHFVLFVEKKNLDLSQLKELLIIYKKINDKDLKVFCRCGIYEIKDASMDLWKMVNNARLARRYMGDDYHESYIIYNESMSSDYVDQAEVLTTYESALANNEFRVFYQPIVHVATGRIASAEALIRWMKPNNKMVSPGLFVPVLERNGFISKLDAFVDKAVYDFQLKRQKQGLFKVPISVNLSWTDFSDEQLMDAVIKKACKGELEKKFVRYEITETAYNEMETNNQELLAKFRESGVDIVLDDFGSGYSSFGMLQDYHFTILKLDMSFIRKLVANIKVQLIVNAIIAMCHRVDIKVVAEGVEHESEVELLRDMNCDYIQGYYFSKPLSEEDFVAYLEKESKLI